MRLKYLAFAVAGWICMVEAAYSPLCTTNKCECNIHEFGMEMDCSKLKSADNEIFLDANFNSENATSVYELYRLSYQNVLIVKINASFPKSSLKIFDLSGTSLFEISDEAFMNLEEMEELILSNNNLQMLQPNAFKGYRLDGQDYPLQSLKTLRLDNNKFHTLNGDLFQHIDRILENLYLNNNPLGVIDAPTSAAINSLVFLKELDLSSTGLHEVPQYFMHTPAYLEWLNLADNNLTSIKDLDLDEAKALTTLILSGNPIVNITEENGFPKVPTLSTVHLCRMPLLETVGQHSLAKLESLEELNMSENHRLVKIDANALIRNDAETGAPVIQSLKRLYIRGNQLTHLEIQLYWEKLEDLDIRDNPWTCECENEFMVETLMPIYDRLHSDHAEHLKCAAPVEMEDKYFYALYNRTYQMRCLDMYGNRPERDGTLLVCLLIGLLLGIVLVLFIMFSRQRGWFGFFDNSPAAFSRRFYGRTKTGDDVDDLS